MATKSEMLAQGWVVDDGSYEDVSKIEDNNSDIETPLQNRATSDGNVTEEKPSYVKSLFENVDTKMPESIVITPSEVLDADKREVIPEVNVDTSIVDSTVSAITAPTYPIPTFNRRTRKVTSNEYKIFNRRLALIDKMDDVGLQNKALDLFSEQNLVHYTLPSLSRGLNVFRQKDREKKARSLKKNKLNDFIGLVNATEALESNPNRTKAQEVKVKRLQKRIIQQSSTSMSDMGKKRSDVREAVEYFAKGISPELLKKNTFGGYALSELDVTKLSPAQIAQASDTADWIIAGKKPKDAINVFKSVGKVMETSKQLGDALTITMRELEKGNEFNALDVTLRNKIFNYTGLSGERAETAFRDKRFQSAINAIRHAKFGSALSKAEIPEFLKSSSTTSRANSDINMAIRSMLIDERTKLDAAKVKLGPNAFNLKFGLVEHNMDVLLGHFNNSKKTTSSKGKKAIGKFVSPNEILGEDSRPTPVAKRTLPDGRVEVKFSDGSTRYAK